jgi:alkylhydroperoxidase family enzyme
VSSRAEGRRPQAEGRRPQADGRPPEADGRPINPALTGRIPAVDPDAAPPEVREVFARQAAQWGAPLAPTLVMAHCPPLVQAAAGLSAALEKSGQLPAELRDLVCLRIAQLVGCPF